jgi:hypothetical protein
MNLKNRDRKPFSVKGRPRVPMTISDLAAAEVRRRERKAR